TLSVISAFTRSFLILFLLTIWRPPRAPLFPYTTLFRSLRLRGEPGIGRGAGRPGQAVAGALARAGGRGLTVGHRASFTAGPGQDTGCPAVLPARGPGLRRSPAPRRSARPRTPRSPPASRATRSPL